MNKILLAFLILISTNTYANTVDNANEKIAAQCINWGVISKRSSELTMHAFNLAEALSPEDRAFSMGYAKGYVDITAQLESSTRENTASVFFNMLCGEYKK